MAERDYSADCQSDRCTCAPEFQIAQDVGIILEQCLQNCINQHFNCHSTYYAHETQTCIQFSSCSVIVSTTQDGVNHEKVGEDPFVCPSNWQAYRGYELVGTASGAADVNKCANKCTGDCVASSYTDYDRMINPNPIDNCVISNRLSFDNENPNSVICA